MYQIKYIMEKPHVTQVNWEEKKKKLKQKFAILTESDFLFVEGKQDEILRRLEVKLGKTKEEINILISGL